jgi:fucose permease
MVLFGLSIIVVDPLIPIISEEIGVGFDEIGIALFIGSIAALIANFIAGRLSDRVDIKKLVLLGLLLLFLGFTLFGAYLNYTIFIIVIIFLRVGFGIIDTSIHSFSSKLFKKNISRVFLKLNIAWYSGAVLGPLVISGILYFEFRSNYIFYIFAFIYVIFIFIFYKICPDREAGKGASSRNNDIADPHKSSLKILKDPVVVMASLVLFIFLGSTMGLTTWLTTYFLGLGIRVAYGSAILSIYWLFSIIGILITTKIVSKYKEVDILFYGCLGGIIFLAVFSFTPFIYIKIAALALQAICFAPIFSLATAITAKRAPKNSGTVLGFTIAFAFAGSIIFQPIYGYVTEYFGKEYIVYIALGGALIGFIFVAVLFRIMKKENTRIPI